MPGPKPTLVVSSLFRERRPAEPSLANSYGICSSDRPSRYPIDVLLVTGSRRDFCSVREIVRGGTWRLAWAATLVSARSRLRETSFAIVLCDSELSDGTWRDIRSACAQMSPEPLIIVTCQSDDVQQWAEALNLGSYDVVAKPLDKTEVMHVLISAWHTLHRKRPERASVNAGRAVEMSYAAD